MYMKLPIIGESGYLYKIYKRNPDSIPRIGESIYLLPNLYSKIEKVSYGGHDLNAVNIYLEPISATYIKELTEEPSKLALKSHGGWKYDDGSSWIDAAYTP